MNDINDIYVFVYDGEIPLSKVLTDEVTKAEWMAREEIVSLWQSGKMVRVIKDLSYFIENRNDLFR